MRTDRLLEMRKRRQLTREDLALRVKTTDKAIQRYENGENVPSADVLKTIAEILEVSTDYLVGLSDSPSDRYREEELTPMERRLIQIHRNGSMMEAIELTTEIFKKREVNTAKRN